MPRVALTFDDGPGPSTEAILDILRKAGVHASFFVLGRNLEEAPWADGDADEARAVVDRIVSEGHLAGNHTYSHAKPEEWATFAGDLRRCDALLGGAPPVRLPYGIRLVEQTIETAAGTARAAVLDPRLAVLASLGRTHVHWTSDFDDWTLGAGAGASLAGRMLAHVEHNAALGLDAVLDLHDGGTGSTWGYERPATVEAVAMFVAEGKRRGWEFFRF